MLTGKEAKQARQSISLSQKKVTESTGISNTDISKLENGRIILPNDQMKTLLDFYHSKEAILPDDIQEQLDSGELDLETYIDQENMVNQEERLDSQVPAVLKNSKIPVRKEFHIDGIVIPETIDSDEAEQLMAEYHENKERIKEYLETPVPRNTSLFFGSDIDMGAVVRNVLSPMAECFAIINRIHGDTSIAKWDTINHPLIDQDGSVETYQDAVEHLFTTPFSTKG